MIDRLLVLKLHAVECEAEAWLNGVPLARVNAARIRAIVPVHEYTVAGVNRLDLVLWPQPVAAAGAPAVPPLPAVSNGKLSAHLRVLLPRIGHTADEATARSLAQIDWAPEEGVAYSAPLTLSHDFPLPVSFPRWRWLDAPPTEPTAALHGLALALVQQAAQSLAAGDPDAFINATRLRTEELAVAYQRDAAAETARWRQHLLAMCEDKRLNWLPMDASGFILRSVAGGRLLECLDGSGAPMLRTAPDEAGRTLAFPLRLAAVEQRLYVLR